MQITIKYQHTPVRRAIIKMLTMKKKLQKTMQKYRDYYE